MPTHFLSRPAFIELQRLGEWLVALSCLYLGLPLFIFCGFWLRAPWNAASVAALLWFFWRLWPRRAARAENPAGESVALRTLWRCFLPFVLLIPLSGVGALAPQHGDWHKHNAILLDLVNRPWPVQYRVGAPEGGDFYLLYYVGFYLPAAALARVFGAASQSSLALILLVWTLLGLSLVAGWIAFWTRGRAAWAGLAFLAFDGLKPLGWALAWAFNRVGWWDVAAFSPLDPQLRWWAGRPHFQYSSPWLALGVVPQHALSGWLAAALLVWAMFHPRARQTPFVLACTATFSALWSVFVGLASAVFTGFAVVLNRKAISTKNEASENSEAENTAPEPVSRRVWPWWFAAWFGGGLALYFAGRGSAPLDQDFPFFPLLAWLGEPALLFNFLLRYALWEMVEWGLLLWVAGHLRARADRRERMILGAALSLLLLLPLFQVGRYNDLLMRGIIVSQFVVFLWIINALRGARLDGTPAPPEPESRPRLGKPALRALLLLAALPNCHYTLGTAGRGALRNWRELRATPSATLRVEDRNLSLLARWQKLNAQPTAGSLEADFSAQTPGEEWRLYRSQYLGRLDSLWWRFLARSDGVDAGIITKNREMSRR